MSVQAAYCFGEVTFLIEGKRCELCVVIAGCQMTTVYIEMDNSMPAKNAIYCVYIIMSFGIFSKNVPRGMKICP